MFYATIISYCQESPSKHTSKNLQKIFPATPQAHFLGILPGFVYSFYLFFQPGYRAVFQSNFLKDGAISSFL